ncbi:MAG: putative membrane protein YkvI [Rhodothermales bacterium]
MIIGGGYGTGRELVEFFMRDGPAAGLKGMAVAMVVWSVVLALSFELARAGRLYDYRSFVSSLLGRAWIAYEVVYLIGLILVVSVLGSAAGTIASEMTGLPEIVGNVAVIGLVGVLAFYGSSLIERVMSVWSFALYAVFALVVIRSLDVFGPAIADALSQNAPAGADAAGGAGAGTWLMSGAEYAAYNVGLVPAMLFVTRHLETRREALTSGVLAGFLAMAPGALIYVAMLGQYPQVLAEPVPSDFLLAALGSPVLRLVFQVILFGTFIETGIGLVHGFNERLSAVLSERGRELSGKLRMVVAAGMLTIAIFLADAVGLVEIIASGYGTLTWGYWLVFVIPVLTLGSWRVFRTKA